MSGRNDKITGFSWETAKRACASHRPAGTDHHDILEEGEACESQDKAADAALAVVRPSVGNEGPAIRQDPRAAHAVMSFRRVSQPAFLKPSHPSSSNGRGESKCIPN